jgi:hypothetical protein
VQHPKTHSSNDPIYENGGIEGVKDFTKLTSPDLFTQFVLRPRKFQKCIHQHRDAVYSSLFAYQVQPFSPDLTCCVVHVVNARNGNGNQQTVEKLEEITEILDTKGFRSLAQHLMEIWILTNSLVNFNSIGISRHSMRQRLICFLIEGRND